VQQDAPLTCFCFGLESKGTIGTAFELPRRSAALLALLRKQSRNLSSFISSGHDWAAADCRLGKDPHGPD
jgi:hypothetical protein